MCPTNDEQSVRAKPVPQIHESETDTLVVEVRAVQDVRSTQCVEPPAQLRRDREDVVLHDRNRIGLDQSRADELQLPKPRPQ